MRYKNIILDLINGTSDHYTAEQIFFLLKEQYPAIVLATVYNNLNTLCAEGAIKRVVIWGQPDKFDRNTRHDHLFCSKCKSVTDLPLEDLTPFLEREIGSEIEFYDLKIRYLCPECRKRE